MTNRVLIPCAGVGARFGTDMPKQYATIGSKTILEHTIDAFLALPEIDQIVVIASKHDEFIDKLDFLLDKVCIVKIGGDTRALSVLNGLKYLNAKENDWILVHDAARCCISSNSVRNLILELNDDDIGGILAIPVTDTIKSCFDGTINKTVDRSNLFLAQTPQMFRYKVLLEAMSKCNLETITDEAGAVEQLGFKVRIVNGETRNIKITYPTDLQIAKFYLGL